MSVDIKSMTIPELEAFVLELGQPKFRGKQLFRWMHGKGALRFDEMTDLPESFREELAQRAFIAALTPERKQVSRLDGTIKLLCRMADGECVETVLMRYRHGNSVCLSTQAGCRMGCTFCASGIGGLKRNLTPSEMIDQLLLIRRETGEKISSVVLMGIGEPLDNYDNVLRFLELLSNPDGIGMSLRHLSLSTCGVVDRIYDLMEKRLQLTLSVSLHAPNDEIRGRMMPINRRWGVDELLGACRDYAEATGRRVSIEYAVVPGVNDSDACAKELGRKLRGMLCHLNLIPINEVRESGYKRAGADNVLRFQKAVGGGISVTVRRTLGQDISAACGQLRRESADIRGE